MLAWLAGPPVTQAQIDDMRLMGVAESEIAKLTAMGDLWDCNEPVMDVLMAMPWRHGAMGPVGLDWSQLPRVHRELRIKRRVQREMGTWLRMCEAWALKKLNKDQTA